MPDASSKLPINVRVMIAIVASPTLMVLFYMGVIIYRRAWQEISISGVIFSVLCIFAYYLVFIGKLPKFASRIKS